MTQPDRVAGWALLETDLAGQIQRGNELVRQVTGFTPAELAGWHLSRLHRDPTGYELERVLEQAATRGAAQIEGWQVRRDGSWFWADWVVLTRAAPAPAGFSVVIHDLTPTWTHLTQARAAVEITDAARHGLGRDGMLNLVARGARDLLGATACAVLTLDGGEDRMAVRAVDGAAPRQLYRTPLALDGTAEGEVVRSRQPLTLPDLPGGQGWHGSPLAAAGLRSAVLVPVPGRGRSAGLITVVDDRWRRFTAADARGVAVLAAQVGLELADGGIEENRGNVGSAHLWAAARDQVASEERHRLAHELHDSVSQALYGIGLNARTARELLGRAPHEAHRPLDHITQLTEAGLAEMRALIFELRPQALAEEGLVAALTKQTALLRTRYDLVTHPVLGAEPAVGMAVKLALYRVAQEALQNVARHARAGNVTVRLTEGPTELTIEIIDDGVGFDPEQRFPGHLGLVSMRKRLTDVGGVLEISSAPGRGTRVLARAPR